MKRIALISNMYYPTMGAPSAVISKYVEKLKDEYAFYIITKTDECHFEPTNEFYISYISSFRHRILQYSLYNIKKGKHIILSRLLYNLVRLSMVIQSQYTFPSSKRWEVKEYYKKLWELYETYHFDTIIAVSDYYVTQMAALKFKKDNPSVKWISFITDPYSENYAYYKRRLFKSLWKKKNLKMEQQIYDMADYCMFTTELYKYIQDNFIIDKKKIYPIYFPLNQRLAGQSKKESSKDSVCHLVFAGMLYKQIRNPEFALSTLSKVKNISLDLYTAKNECEDIITRYESDIIHRYFYVSRLEYEEMIRDKYDILVNIGNISTLQAPSKTLELLSTGKPIINFYFTEDTQFEMIEKYPLGLNVKNQEEGAVEKVSGFCSKNKGKILPFDEVEKLYPDYKLQNQVNILRLLIET